MTATKRLASYAVGLVVLLGVLPNPAKAQIAYEPIPGFVPTGVTMTVTPVVSADRRYVRVGVNAFFNNLNGFSTFSFPGGAVGGGNFGGGALGGVNVGMDGIIGDEGYESGVQVGNGMNPPRRRPARHDEGWAITRRSRSRPGRSILRRRRWGPGRRLRLHARIRRGRGGHDDGDPERSAAKRASIEQQSLPQPAPLARKPGKPARRSTSNPDRKSR